MAAPASRVCDPFPRTVTCIDAKRTSMLIHTALTNGHIPPVRGVTGLPGAMSGCGATCTSRGLPGVVGISGRSEVARWKATITAVVVVYLDCPTSVGSANGGQVSVSVGQRRIFSAQWHSSRAYRGACHGTNQRRCNKADHKHDDIKRSCITL